MVVSNSFSVDRPLSLSLRLPIAAPGVSREVVLEKICGVVPRESISCLQRLNERQYDITFKAGFGLNRENLLISGVILDGIQTFFTEASVRSVKVTVKNLPSELSNNVLRDALSQYGSVSSFHKVTEDGIWNGDRLVSMTLRSDIPSLIKIGKYPAFIRYRGQRLCCHYCNQWDHAIKDCRYKREGLCIRCGEPGHVARLCRRAWVTSALSRDQGSSAAGVSEDFPALASDGGVAVSTALSGENAVVGIIVESSPLPPDVSPSEDPVDPGSSVPTGSNSVAVSSDVMNSSEDDLPPNQQALKRPASPSGENIRKKPLGPFEDLIPCSELLTCPDIDRVLVDSGVGVLPVSENPYDLLVDEIDDVHDTSGLDGETSDDNTVLSSEVLQKNLSKKGLKRLKARIAVSPATTCKKKTAKPSRSGRK